MGRSIFCGQTRLVSDPEDLGGGFHLLRVEAPEAARAAQPGNFAMLSLEGNAAFLPRPFAIFGADASKGLLEFLVRPLPRGRMTPNLVRLSTGDHLRLTAPLGRPWRIDGTARRAVLVAGGTGYAALRMLALELIRRGRDVCVVWGEATSCRFPTDRLLAELSGRLVCSTEDGSHGECGTSVDCLCRLLARAGTEGLELYAAGPVGMLRAVAQKALELAIPCQVSLEARMACGFGACRGCTVDATLPHPETGLRKRAVCSDGPVFDGAEIDWRRIR